MSQIYTNPTVALGHLWNAGWLEALGEVEFYRQAAGRQPMTAVYSCPRAAVPKLSDLTGSVQIEDKTGCEIRSWDIRDVGTIRARSRT